MCVSFHRISIAYPLRFLIRVEFCYSDGGATFFKFFGKVFQWEIKFIKVRMATKEATGFPMLWIEACHLSLSPCPLYWVVQI